MVSIKIYFLCNLPYLRKKIQSVRNVYLDEYNLDEFIKEAQKRGFKVGEELPDGSVEKSLTTYKCAKDGEECKLYFWPSKFIYDSHHNPDPPSTGNPYWEINSPYGVRK